MSSNNSKTSRGITGIGRSVQDPAANARLNEHDQMLEELRLKLIDATAESQKAAADARSAAEDTKKQLNENRGLVVFGFIVLIVMVAAMLIDILLARIDSNSQRTFLVPLLNSESYR